MTDSAWQFWIDRGGTFTDLVARAPDGTLRVAKLLSRDHAASGRDEDAALAGIRRLLGLGADEALPAGAVAAVKMGTTVGTNALLERRGEPCALVVNRGFRDLLAIGTQHRPDIFALDIRRPAPLYVAVIEVSARTGADGTELAPLDRETLRRELEALHSRGLRALAVALAHAYRHPAHERAIEEVARAVGFTQVSLSHGVSPLVKLVGRAETAVVDAYLTPVLARHTARLRAALGDTPLYFMRSDGGLCGAGEFSGKDCVLSGPAGGLVGAVRVSRQAGFSRVISFDMGGTSTDVAYAGDDPAAGEFPRELETEVAGVRLRTPVLAVHTVAAGGGSICRFDGSRLVVGPESAGADPGPASYRRGGPLTVTDCNVLLGRVRPEHFPRVFGPGGDAPLDAAAVRAKFAALAAAVRTGERWPAVTTPSEAAASGPSGAGGNPDARHAAPGVRDADAADAKAPDAQEPGAQAPVGPEALAEGCLAVAVEHMAQAIRAVTAKQGVDPRECVLTCFGGAGGQHACQLARGLGVHTVLIPRLAGVLSAYGMGLAERRELSERSVEADLDDALLAQLAAACADAEQAAAGRLGTGCLSADRPSADRPDAVTLTCLRRARLRYRGSDTALEVPFAASAAALRRAFEDAHQRRFGFALPDTPVVVSVIASEVVAAGEALPAATPVAPGGAQSPGGASTPGPEERVLLYHTGGWRDVPLLRRETLSPGARLTGPALIVEANGSHWLEPGWRAQVDAHANLILEDADALDPAAPDPVTRDPAQLALFARRFTAVAEEMGDVLRQTAHSVNIKERLDFSCAVFNARGELVANAPHIPVHLGSMGESVVALLAAFPPAPRATDRKSAPAPGVRPGNESGGEAGNELGGECRDDGPRHGEAVSGEPGGDEPGGEQDGDGDGDGAMREGDVFLLNSPFHGGTHLPDITVVAPVFAAGRLAFFTAARGHHADVGGLTPGSMPPASTRIDEEGVCSAGMRVVAGGRFREAELRAWLKSGPHPARDPDQNLADLKAQVAACHRGAELLGGLAGRHGLAAVTAYMGHVLDAGEEAVRRALARLTPGACEFRTDHGASVRVTVRVDRSARAAVIDFSGTSPQTADNFNAPLAVTKAAVLYVFRTLVAEDVPLNAGCLRPLSLIAPEGSLVNPRPPAAVVAGNVETSQHLCNALYGALGVLAASQGTMNNFTFGDAGHQYYETIAGGAGAGRGFAGASAVQTHMTNSRITDPEILELRHPVVVEEFSIRRGSGGAGRWRGGDGAVRRIRFTAAMTAAVLSSHRLVAPFGLAGGGPGMPGRNAVVRADGRVEELPACAQVALRPGDVFVIETPGGGGYGHPGDETLA